MNRQKRILQVPLPQDLLVRLHAIPLEDILEAFDAQAALRALSSFIDIRLDVLERSDSTCVSKRSE